uniref:RNA polymerase sigma factor n=1 Tax=Herbidospora sakaeratensis TaxID=564415 RepID=UPI0007859160|nr:sigma-70 family RNA polymerase sigma factor [Herbidospora sakaeratensis]
MDVADLVKGAAGGDEAAWNALVARFTGLLWAVTAGFGLGDDDRRDVVQEAWLRLAERLDRIEQPDKVGGWLATTARREALRLAKAAGRVTPAGDGFLADVRSPDRTPEQVLLDAEQAALDAARATRLLAAFDQLGQRCRDLLRILSATPPPSYLEIAATLDMPVGSIGPTRARCLKSLRAKVGGPD